MSGSGTYVHRSAWRSRAACAAAVVLVMALSGCGGASDVAESQSAGSTESLTPTPTSSSGNPSATAAPSPTDTSDTSGAVPSSAPVAPTAQQLGAARSRPVEDPYYPSTSNPEVDALHYGLALDWDGRILTGTTTLVFRAALATDTVRLDLSNALSADAVELDGQGIDFSQARDGLEMMTGALARNSRHTLTISYSGTPHSTPAPSQRSDMTEGNGWVVGADGSVYTFQEPSGAFTWYPVNDHPSDKAFYDAEITSYDGDVGVFNGRLMSSDQAGSATTNTWHLDQPAASYLVTLAIGPYTETVTPSPDGMPISYWLLPQDQGKLPQLRAETGEAFDWLVRKLGPYPFATLGIVVVGGASAMETQTMITLSRDVIERPDAVIEHELAHQWFGDTVSPLDWQALWLNEGWAMYMQQWYERATGRYQYAGGLSQWRPYDQQSRRTSGPPGDYDPRSFGDVNVYLGPAMMLDEIRQLVGNRVFAQVCRGWPAMHRNQSVDREDFTSWLNRTTGRDFGPLMHRWLDSRSTPRWTP